VRSENPEVQGHSQQKYWSPCGLPFKDQKSADAVRKQLSNISNKISHALQPVFKNREICEDQDVRAKTTKTTMCTVINPSSMDLHNADPPSGWMSLCSTLSGRGGF